MASVEQFHALLKQSNSLGVGYDQLNRLESVKRIQNEGKRWRQRNLDVIVFGSILFLFSAGIYSTQWQSRIGFVVTQKIFDYFAAGNVSESICIFGHAFQMLRAPADCNACAEITDVVRVANLSQKEFMEKYAYTMQPVVVTDGQRNWTARETFNYEYFKGIYSPGSEALKTVNERCQFFQYNTNMSSMEEFFNISQNRLEGNEDHWYIGWSNCGGKSGNMLRGHYKLPYFLPVELDHSMRDWIFMGLPGPGAPMHVDFVHASSWQAQLSGYKKWTLSTPPECFGTCTRHIEFVVGPGEIMVFDGTKWFHQTDIIGNETSIVIGSEYY